MLNRKEDLHEAVAKGTPMHGSATNYLAVETAMSGLCNAVLNLAAAFALFHGRDSVPATGPGSLLMDSIGETFLVIALSMSVPYFDSTPSQACRNSSDIRGSPNRTFGQSLYQGNCHGPSLHLLSGPLQCVHTPADLSQSR